ncbi:uncharacterized protein B0H18DRAFT_936945 [Fomitopsis serialis]|uniref:uncharacterized protein n=1 Tax=Fomitopsis serialis TaxID=139415 RepID=UPI0020080CC6|nr:uncharacterized protein B0H18DRAFT_936945 [Neoantrodia serialis]KAH9919802.1 hypothetical protein B0H18DRAFT_936945 [Neoantrodia serialis]
MMLWSDATHLATFGDAKAWPVYVFFGNLSKYVRRRTSSLSCHHVAYIPSLPDSVRSFIRSFRNDAGKKSSPILTHCRRELFHAIWKHLLDEDFVKAYIDGIVIKCADGVTRRVYPRIFTYSADYPEKVLIAAIRDKGLCPCPRCYVPQADIFKMGQKRDLARRSESRLGFLRNWSEGLRARIMKARDLIYNSGLGVVSAAVERVLKPWSLVPTLNAFAARLGDGFNVHSILVPDFLHEVELGVWKALFTHLVRILYAAAPSGELVIELNSRYRQIPTFGRGTIRRFAENASEMKKMAARDFEDLLQCAIPVFEGLLPAPYNDAILTLLFRFAEWHALAKLRMHNESSLESLRSATSDLGRLLRHFRDHVCPAFNTVELPREAESRARQADKTGTRTSRGRQAKTFNLDTYKWHSFGDYVFAIATFGTSDVYSTQDGEFAHRRLKRLYRVTNKNDATKQLARHERRETILQRAHDPIVPSVNVGGETSGSASHGNVASHPHHVQWNDSEPLPYTDVHMHHHISDSRQFPQHLDAFVHRLGTDPAGSGHLLSRLLGKEFDGDEEQYSEDELDSLQFIGNKIYSHKVLRVNYTTYDVRRGQDSMNPRTHCDVMVRSCESEPGAHPYWYARVLGIFHADVLQRGRNIRNRSVQRMEFLWVRWFGIDTDYRSGHAAARLPKIGFVEESDPDAFGFLDPSLVIRGCHLMPTFADGKTSQLLSRPNSVARPMGETEDWEAYYVGIFVDRDMSRRYLGIGIGHTASHSGSRPRDSGSEERDLDEDMADTVETSEAEAELDEDEEDGIGAGAIDDAVLYDKADGDLPAAEDGDSDPDENEDDDAGLEAVPSEDEDEEEEWGNEIDLGPEDGDDPYVDDDMYF